MFTMNLKMSYLGFRSYVHGSSMLEGMLDCAYKHLSSQVTCNLAIRKFKILRELNTQAYVELLSPEEASGHSNLRDAIARLELKSKNHDFIVLLFSKKEHLVKEYCIEYDSRIYVNRICVDSLNTVVGEISTVETFTDFIRAIIECNRQGTVCRLESPSYASSVRWTSLHNLKIPSLEHMQTISQVIYTQSNVVQSGNWLFEFKKGHFPEVGDLLNHEICFCMRKSN